MAGTRHMHRATHRPGPSTHARDDRPYRRATDRVGSGGASYLLFDLDVAALHRVHEGIDHPRVEARPGEALDLLDDVADLHRLLVRTVGGHRVERVRDGHDARLHRDLFAL